MIVSIFNDVVGPVMRGPSSSHCAAALRIGRLARDLMNGRMDRVLIEFDRGGSLPTTHRSQGSDMGLFGGLLGWTADDPRLPDSERWLADAGIQTQFEYGEYGDAHPNTYRLTLFDGQRQRQLIAISTGGGMFEVVAIDDMPVSIGGDFDETLVWLHEKAPAAPGADCLRDRWHVDDVLIHAGDDNPMVQIRGRAAVDDAKLHESIDPSQIRQVDRLRAVLPVRSRRDISVPFTSCNAMIEHDGDRDSELWKLAIEYEVARSGLSETEVIEKMVQLVGIVRSSVQEGLAGTEYEDRVLGFQSGGFHEAMQNGMLADTGVLNRMVLYTTALMEVKSSMGVIIAAPTAGACAAFPAVCLSMGESLNLSDQHIARGMLAGGLIGVFIATHWSFAAEVGGCQAEGGSAAAMSAAAIVTYLKGSRDQAVSAASMALQNMLGLICDPVANRVEVPCLGKNVMAASNAVACANMALSGYDCVIPLDETIGAAKAVAERMPREHRCTALGGLAATLTSISIEKRLQT